MTEQREMSKTTHLAVWLGIFGAHRFYTGYKAIGFVQLFTLGGLTIWSFVDVISILLNKYKDTEGRSLANYNKKVAIIYCILYVLVVIAKLSGNIE